MADVATKVLTRTELIGLLRQELLRRAGDDQSICRAAAEQGIFCNGFSRFNDAQLRRRYDWIVRRYPDVDRQELEEIADRWQLARQDVGELPTACDVQQSERDTCCGWDDFSNEELARFYVEMSGRKVVVHEQ